MVAFNLFSNIYSETLAYYQNISFTVPLCKSETLTYSVDGYLLINFALTQRWLL